MSIGTEQILMVIGGASTIATSLFWGAVYLGRLTARIERVETIQIAYGQRLNDHDEEFRFLKGLTPQK